MRGIVLALLLLAPTVSAALPEAPVADTAGSVARFALFPGAGEYLVHRNVDVADRLGAIAAEHPELATVESAGTSVLGQELSTITLQHPESTGKYRVYIDGGHHGNEYFGVELAMAFLGWIVEGYEADDPAVLEFLSDHVVKILPMVNPDGNLLDTRKNARQVDLNRNYPFLWGDTSGSGDMPTDFTYHGPSALSEPETSANWAQADAFDPHIWVTMHTGIAELYWPWGYTGDPSPDDALFRSLEAPFENASNGRVDAKQGFELYPVTGANDDSAYALLGVPGFTFEVHEDQSRPAYPGGIPPAIADQLAGLVWLVSHTKHLGANLAATMTLDGDVARVRLANEGWGVARNVTVNVTLDGAVVATRVVDVPARGSLALDVPGVPAGAAIEASYPRLLVGSSPVWTTAATAGDAMDEAAARLVPGPGLLAVVALGALALVRRR